MRQLMILGGMLGFAIGVGFGLACRSPWPDILWRASVAAFLAGMALRWWGNLWVNGLQQSNREKRAQALKASNN